jgi:hypothetical protein
MSVITNVSKVKRKDPETYPVLRRSTGCEKMVVMFTDSEHGVVLDWPNQPNRVGKVEGGWVNPFDQEAWGPCSITLTSEN